MLVVNHGRWLMGWLLGWLMVDGKLMVGLAFELLHNKDY